MSLEYGRKKSRSLKFNKKKRRIAEKIKVRKLFKYKRKIKSTNLKLNSWKPKKELLTKRLRKNQHLKRNLRDLKMRKNYLRPRLLRRRKSISKTWKNGKRKFNRVSKSLKLWIKNWKKRNKKIELASIRSRKWEDISSITNLSLLVVLDLLKEVIKLKQIAINRVIILKSNLHHLVKIISKS